ncbi:MAG: IPT/TIG domain-containing protein [Phycisphaerae bacterium]
MNAKSLRPLTAVLGPCLALLLGGCPQSLIEDAISKDESSELATARRITVTPATGPASGGTFVTIHGGPFDDNVSVRIGGKSAVNPIVVSDSTITAFTPVHNPGDTNIEVTADGTMTGIGDFFYNQLNPSIDIISLSPPDGPVAGGTEVTITGQNLTPGTVVTFGSRASSSVHVLNNELLVAVAPPGIVGAVDVGVRANNRTDILPKSYSYRLPAPEISSLEPSEGPLAGGTRIAIRGMNLPSEAQVYFGDTAAQAVVYISSRMITAVSPAAQSAGPIVVSLAYEGDSYGAGEFSFLPNEDPIFDDGTDTDGDGLTDVQETTGWDVWTEEFGLQLGVDTFGNVTRYSVTADVNNADTDADGLDDFVEFIIKTHPRKHDTDDDGLWDNEEWNQWWTSPTGVDTDADARGDRELQNAPNQALFDGAELFNLDVLFLPPGHVDRVVRARATSPTLSDTDGDSVSDYDEFDSTVRNAVVADLPRLEYELVGDVDVRLNVEYAESNGQTKEYGTTLGESQSNTVASSFSHTVGWSLEVMNNVSLTLGIIPSIDTEVTAGVHGEYTWTSSNESTQEMTKEYSRVQSDSREFTQTAADGAIRTAILLKNEGNITFALDGLSVLVSQRQKLKPAGDTGIPTPLTTITTMQPSFDSIALAPGETAGPFELSADGVNGDAIKALMSRPDSLILGTAAMNFRDQNGIDYDFVQQYTAAQTATIVMDFADGEIHTYNVATNVNRDGNANYLGIRLQRVMEEVLGLPYGDAENGYTTHLNGLTNLQVLDAIQGRLTEDHEPAGFDYWTVRSSNPDHANYDFNDVTLKAGDRIYMYYQQDTDADGLSDTIEKAVGTDQSPLDPSDYDGDLVSDQMEVVFGWICFEDPNNPDAPHPDGFAKRRVFSDPREKDADGDGLDDWQESQVRSDPNDPDTDGDGLLDGEDPFPIRKAVIRYVDAHAPGPIHDGTCWEFAYTDLSSAFFEATAGQNTPTPDDDVSQIWVAEGEYLPPGISVPFTLLNQLGVYGGFSGADGDYLGETKRGQRVADGRINGCILTGDFAGNDIGPASALDGTPAISPLTRLDNAWGLMRVPSTADASARLDGFTLTSSGWISAVLVDGSPTIENCLFVRNGVAIGGGMRINGGQPVIRNCIFAENAATRGGGVYIQGAARPRFEGCSFEQNKAQRTIENDDTMDVNGGGLYLAGANGARVELIECSFVGNEAFNWGGGLFADAPANSPAYVRVESCRFNNNIITRGSAGGDYRGAGGGMFLRADAAVFNSVFWANNAENHGGGIMTFRKLAVNNCTISGNRAWGTSDGGGLTAGEFFGFTAEVTVENSILWGNWRDRDELPDNPEYLERHQLQRRDGATMTVRNSCFNRPEEFRGGNNFGTDPDLIDMENGDLRLGPDSPCIDRGNAFVDVEPLRAGLQKLPEFDFYGNLRISDGNGDGFETVDIGAFEYGQQ